MYSAATIRRPWWRQQTTDIYVDAKSFCLRAALSNRRRRVAYIYKPINKFAQRFALASLHRFLSRRVFLVRPVAPVKKRVLPAVTHRMPLPRRPTDPLTPPRPISFAQASPRLRLHTQHVTVRRVTVGRSRCMQLMRRHASCRRVKSRFLSGGDVEGRGSP